MGKTIQVHVYLGIISITLFLCPSFLQASTIYVNSSAAGADNGTSWADAFISLSNALTSASYGDEIWVAAGVYKPDTPVDLNSSGGFDPREFTFNIPDGVKIYGGFAGSEAMLEERDWENNLTILSGDIDNNDFNADGNFIAEDVAHIAGCNSYHVIFTENVSAETMVDGFIITAGSADITLPEDAFDPNLDGGGWYNKLSEPVNASSPAIINSVFQGNYAKSEGGAIYNAGSDDGEVLSLIQNSRFIKNKSDITGGAIYLGSFSPGNYQPHIMNCEFSLNEAFRRGGAIYLVGDHSIFDSTLFYGNKVTAISPDFSTLPGSGGGVNLVSSNAVFTACIFDSNMATGNPTGPYEGGGGGAVYASANEPQTSSLGASEPKFISCGFYSNSAGGNTAAWGGAVLHLSDAGILLPGYINCVFNNNQAQDHGGGAANFIRVISAPEDFIPALEPEFTNCTFNGNIAGERGGALYNDGFLFMGSEILISKLENCILWNDIASSEGPEVYNTGTNLVSYSLIDNSGGSGGGWDNSIGTDAGNNIDEDPLFIDESDPAGVDDIPANSDDGLMLSALSPSLDIGNNLAAGLTGIINDFAGNPRVQNSFVDIGAYEYGPDGSSGVTSVSNTGLPDEFSLAQNYPNPFNPVTKIKYNIPSGISPGEIVQLKIYDILGNEIVTLVNEEKPAGNYEVEFDGTGLVSGVYIYKLSAGHQLAQSRKLILVK